MKLLSKIPSKTQEESTITFMPEEPEDIWHAYNLIRVDDLVRCTTIRKVVNQTATGSSTSQRVRTTITIKVEDVDYDTQASVLRIKGRNASANEHIKMNAYHCLDIEVNKRFSLTKTEWDCITLERINMACDPAQSADVAAVVMQNGVAYICLITTSMTIVRSKIDVTIPRKRNGYVKHHEKGLAKFYESIMQGILRHINFNVVKCVLLASPGFVREQFFKYMVEQAVHLDLKVLLDNKSKFLLVHSSSGFKHSLKEVLQDPAVIAKMSDTKAAGEVKMLEQFYTMLQFEPAKAFYGKRHVEAAANASAIETLLISDNLFRSPDIKLRKEYIALVESVRESGGEVKIFSSMHVSGEQLAQLTGIAAILRFPMPELEEIDVGNVDDDDDSDSGNDTDN